MKWITSILFDRRLFFRRKGRFRHKKSMNALSRKHKNSAYNESKAEHKVSKELEVSETLLINLLDLNDDILVEIMKYLSPKDLKNVRLVSRRTKVTADYALQIRCKKFTLSSNCKSTDQIEYLLSKVYKGSKKLVLDTDWHSLSYLLNITSIYLNDVEKLKLTVNVIVDDISVISKHFPNLTQLHLIETNIEEESVSHLLSSLPKLQKIKINCKQVTGICFQELRSGVISLKWIHSNEFFALRNDLNFGRSINKFCLKSNSLTHRDQERILSIIKREMHNLQSLHLDIGAIISLNELHSLPLKQLFIHCDSKNYNISTLPFNGIEELTLKTSDLTDWQLSIILSYFPNLKYLTLILGEPCFLTFSPKVMDNLNALFSLRSLMVIDSSADRFNLIMPAYASLIALPSIAFVGKAEKLTDEWFKFIKYMIIPFAKNRSHQNIFYILACENQCNEYHFLNSSNHFVKVCDLKEVNKNIKYIRQQM